MVIYKILNKINNKIYIGQTVNKVSIRWSQHIHYSLKRTGKSVLANAIRKYGQENFDIKVLAHCNTIEEMNHREQYYIKLFNTLAPNGYNLDSGGKNKIMHSSTKEKLSKCKIGKKIGKFTKDHCRAISIALKKAGIRPILNEEQMKKRALSQIGTGNGMFGKKHTDESKKMMSENKKGRKCGSDNPFFGKKHTLETKEKIRMARLLRNNK